MAELGRHNSTEILGQSCTGPGTVIAGGVQNRTVGIVRALEGSNWNNTSITDPKLGV